MALDLAGHQTPTLEVRNHAGELVGRVPLAKADQLVAAGLCSAFTRHGRTKYLLLNRDEPTVDHSWRGGSNTTERIRNEWGTIIGAPNSGLQHKPLPREN